MLVRRYQLSIVLLSVLSSFACATAPQKPNLSNIELEAQAQEVIKLELSYGGLDAFIERATEQGVQAGKDYFEQLVKRPIYYEEHARVREVYRRAFAAVFTQSDLAKTVAPVYVKYLSPQEMVELLRFYQTPIGAKMLKIQYVLRAENIKEVEKLYQQKKGELRERFLEEFEKEFLESAGEP
jgi:hypothetical protein